MRNDTLLRGIWLNLSRLDGTATRRDFWTASLAVSALSTLALILAVLSILRSTDGFGIIVLTAAAVTATGFLQLAALLPVSIRRCRDTGLPGRAYPIAMAVCLAVLPLHPAGVLAGSCGTLSIQLFLGLAPSGLLKARPKMPR